MKARPRIGLTGEHRFTVEPRHCIDFATGGMPAVFSTPQMVGLLERTAREAVAPLLDDNERTVGVEIEIRHLAPTPPGSEVTLTAKVVHSEGSFITFHIEARDTHELLARGIHKRAVVRIESFARRVDRKKTSRPT